MSVGVGVGGGGLREGVPVLAHCKSYDIGCNEKCNCVIEKQRTNSLSEKE